MSKANRKLKVGYQWRGKRPVPQLLLAGEWLRQMGFELTDQVEVMVQPQKLVITKWQDNRN